jgi:regulator of sigma E protease
MAMVETIFSYVPLVLILALVIVVHRLGHQMVGWFFYGAGQQEDLDLSFGLTSVWPRIVIVLAGPAANLLLGMVLFWGLLIFVGGSVFPFLSNTVGQVKAGFPAAQAGIRAGDRIVAVNGDPVPTWEELARQVQSHAGRAINLTVDRGVERFEIILNTRASTERTIKSQTLLIPAIGVTPAGNSIFDRLPPQTALVETLKRTRVTFEMTLMALEKLIMGAASPQMIGRLVLGGQMARLQIQQDFLTSIILLTAHLSIILGVLSLLPLPFVDGGRLCFLGIELLRGRPVSLRVQMTTQWVIVFLLAAVMILAVFRTFYDEIFQFLKTL